MDMNCAKCGEPWDAYGVRHATDMTRKEANRFMHGEGCPGCGFGETCVRCGGVGRVYTGCDTCRSNGLVFVRKLAAPPAFLKPGDPMTVWTMGWLPDLRPLSCEPFRRLEDENSLNGRLLCGMARCPDCQQPGAEQGDMCPDCGGDGRLHVTDPVGTWETAVQSALDASDEDPIDILHRFSGF